MLKAPVYTITEVIHESTTTTVHRGYRNSDRAPVAIKRLKNERPTPTEIAKLRYEYAIAKDLSMPGVVKVYGLEKVESNLAIVMEDTGGRALNDVLGSRKLSPKEVLQLAISMARALESVHQSGVIHMDIKPHNIIVDMEKLEAQLTDFGSATRLAQEMQKRKAPNSLEGTLAYMSPEQTGRINCIIDLRTDLYSLGVTMYEMATGVLPFQTKDPIDLVHSHIARLPAPPHEVAVKTPRALSDIIMKLLAKNPDHRYQSTHGLVNDLEECQKRIRANGTIEPFPLGSHDYVDELRIPQTIYGRDKELAALLDAWEHANEGTTEFLLVSGYAGIGKSVLVNTIQRVIASRNGYFVSGKFDQLNRAVPYAVMGHVYRELVRNILTQSPQMLSQWKTRIEHAVGQNGQVLIDLIPELELVIGPQPAVQPLGATESQNRFNLTFQNFSRAFASKDYPLVIFLDDLQWIDPASLKLLQSLVTEARPPYTLLIGAYRDNEVDGTHLFSLALAEIRKAKTFAREIKLQPLTFPIVNELIADTLSCDPARSEPLAKAIFDKTQGNPFFMKQFMKTLNSEKLLTYDLASHAWKWDLAPILKLTVTDNVVQFMGDKIRRLSASSQRILTLAACIGHRFDLKTLAIINDKPLVATAHELLESLHEGLVIALDSESRFLSIRLEALPSDEANSPDSALNADYTFLHDRVQQAAYSLIEDAQKGEVHLRIGRLMLASSASEPVDTQLFEVVYHMNRGATLIRDPQERLRIAKLNIEAGKKSKSGTAYESAATYLEAAQSLLGSQSWETEFAMTFALYTELAECKQLCGQVDAARALFDVLSSHAKTKFDHARIYKLRMNASMAQGNFVEFIKHGLEALGLLGVQIPQAADQRDLLLRAELEEMHSHLVNRTIASLVDLPMVEDPEHEIILTLLNELGIATAVADFSLAVLLTLKQINASIRFGNSDTSAYGYASYAVLAMSGTPSLGDDPNRLLKDGYEFAKLGIALNEKINNPKITCKLLLSISMLLHFFEPLRGIIAHIERARRAGLEVGELAFASYSCMHLVAAKLMLGDELDSLDEEIDQNLLLMQQTHETMTPVVLTAAKQIIANLKGRTKSRLTLSNDSFDESEFASTVENPLLIFPASWYKTFRLQLYYLHGHYNEARALIAPAQTLTAAWPNYFWATPISFYACLTWAALYDSASAAEKEEYMALLTTHHAKLTRWAELCPANYLHKKLLVDAEVARISGKAAEAMVLYEQAINAANENGFVADEAMAAEIYARFHLANGRLRSARIYFLDAYYGYAQWGATAKAEDIVASNPTLRLAATVRLSPTRLRQQGTNPRSLNVQTGSTSQWNTSVLDVEAVIAAAQVIAGEVALNNVIKRLMDLAIKNAGAQRGVLVLEREQQLVIEAAITTEPHSVKIGEATPIEKSADVPISIVQYVARTKEVVVLSAADQEARFASDPYIAANAPKSILCLAICHQDRATGILYLENRITNDVFTRDRLEIVKLLLAQAASAIENALLYSRLQSRTEALQETEHRLMLEFAERERGEQARAALQEEIIRVQNDRLAELSTPIIPISDQIMVMPLIGMMDSRRAQQVLTTALEGVQTNGAGVVIIDITGVKLVDSDVASTLINTASALKLLGAQVVLTGIRPQVAQTIIGMGIDFGTLVTRATLQSGISYALKQTGRKSDALGRKGS
jgi:predicted ATPase/anti-anti-sigma regulatory factor/tRNA A-37 threonylcarbamoyl transferase component Bud32